MGVRNMVIVTLLPDGNREVRRKFDRGSKRGVSMTMISILRTCFLGLTYQDLL
jgi:hypothetical protein